MDVNDKEDTIQSLFSQVKHAIPARLLKQKTVTTKEELKNAKNSGVDEIIVIGELADQLKKAQRVSKMGAAGLATLTGILGAAAVTAPVTGGLSFAVAAPVAAMTGMEIAAIIAASVLGIALIISLFKDYEEIGYSQGRLRLRKRRKKDG